VYTLFQKGQFVNSTIPKRIIQTGKNFDLPLRAKAAVATIRLLNPDFEYLFFNDEQVESFIEKHYPDYRSIFHAFPFPIQRFDFFRYLAIYHYGGFYFDLDVYMARSLEDLLAFGCVFPFEEITINGYLRDRYGMDWEIGNYAFGASSGHPFLLEIIRNCIKAQKEPEWAQPMVRSIPKLSRDRYMVLCTTGPGLISRTLAEYPDAAGQVRVLFPENVCDPSTWHNFGEYGVHLMEGTWGKRKNALLNRLTWMLESRVTEKAMRASRKRGPMRSLDFAGRA
jgi:inositol phosphorylceramide mannosyltransferase catalytic subunit